jgi:serine/threonine-protein kinase HipA
MEIIMKEVFSAITCWKEIAKEIGISRAEQEMMASAFRV